MKHEKSNKAQKSTNLTTDGLISSRYPLLLPCFAACGLGQQEQGRGQQAESQGPPAQSRGGPVAQVSVTAHVGVVEGEARGELLPTQATLGRHGTALLIQGELQGASGACGHTGEAALVRGTFQRKLQAVHRGDGRKHTGEAAQTACQWKTAQEDK